jgi:hypothetical protein
VEVRTISQMFAAAGIRRTGFLMLDAVEESLQFAGSLHLDLLKITVGLRIYPGTALAAAAVATRIQQRTPCSPP